VNQGTVQITVEVAMERQRQDVKFPGQDVPDGTGPVNRNSRVQAARAQRACEYASKHHTLTWRHILAEEVAEAFAEDDPELLRAELIQVAAVAVRWVEALDRRARR
jgi:hypothetical protein